MGSRPWVVNAALVAGVIVTAVSMRAIFPQLGMPAALVAALPLPAVLWAIVLAAKTYANGGSPVPEEDLASSYSKGYYEKMRGGWVVPASSAVVKKLQLGSIALPLRAHAIPKIYRWYFNDWWVCGWLAYAVAAFVVVATLGRDAHGAGYVIAAFGMLRLFELLSYHVELAFFNARTRANLVASATRTALLTLVNFAEVVLWFGTFYVLLATTGHFTVDGPAAIVLLDESFVEMVANSESAVHPLSPTAWTFCLAHRVIGLFMTSVVLSRVITLLTLPEPLRATAVDEPPPDPDRAS